MAVQWVAEWRVNPGRLEDAMALFSEFESHVERLGLTNQRLLAVSVVGDSPFETFL